ncbi:hypothetical protein DBV15_07553 [Temnothorax longispinosus]|uniref:Uncharacterized protein n=1 Tax=Temnothorax longispinosus TaxID=300112 RepID=A0A4S2KX32_9HYME|nr:hypothetical protein DBV15_07553 [Temnothorax longispinosus]
MTETKIDLHEQSTYDTTYHIDREVIQSRQDATGGITPTGVFTSLGSSLVIKVARKRGARQPGDSHVDYRILIERTLPSFVPLIPTVLDPRTSPVSVTSSLCYRSFEERVPRRSIYTMARLIAKLAEKASKEFRRQQAEEGRLLRSKANYFIPTCRLRPVQEVNGRRYRIEWTPSFKSPFSRFLLGFARATLLNTTRLSVTLKLTFATDQCPMQFKIQAIREKLLFLPQLLCCNLPSHVTAIGNFNARPVLPNDFIQRNGCRGAEWRSRSMPKLGIDTAHSFTFASPARLLSPTSHPVINRSRVQVDYLHHLGLVEAEEVCIPAQWEQDRPGRTGDYFARIAPSSQKAALLICLRYGDRGLPIITYDPLLAAGAISPAATNRYGEDREMGEIGDWKPRPNYILLKNIPYSFVNDMSGVQHYGMADGKFRWRIMRAS